MNLVNAKIQLLDQFHSYLTQAVTQSMNRNVVAASQWKPKQSFMANEYESMLLVSAHSFKVERWNLHVVYGCGCPCQHHTIAISCQSCSASVTQRREPVLPSLLAGSQKAVSLTYVGCMCLFSTYLSFREAKPRVQRFTWFYSRGLKLSRRYSFRGGRERTCVRIE